MRMSLSDWLKSGWLVAHSTNRHEITDLLAVAERDLRECQVSGLSPDWRLAIAYNSALQFATAALAAAGYRAARGSHHYRTIQSLAFTLEASSDLIAELDDFRKKRNVSDYDRAGAVSKRDSQRMLDLATLLKKIVVVWLKKEHPDLMS